MRGVNLGNPLSEKAARSRSCEFVFGYVENAASFFQHGRCA
jgi:hypothetical protein